MGGLNEIVPRLAGLIDFILNIVGLLLWFNWRATGLKPVEPRAMSLAGALQRTTVVEGSRWLSLVSLIILLCVRALFYWRIGSQVDWVPNLDLTAIALPFRSDLLGRMFLFSGLSFALTLGGAYASLLLLSVINKNSNATDYFCRLILLQLWWFGKAPWPVRLVIGPIIGGLCWLALSQMFVSMGMAPAPKGTAHLWQQAGVMALVSALAWKYLLALFLLGHVLNTYIYFGNASFWKYVTLTGERLTLPLRWLRFGKLDLGPIALLILLFFAVRFAGAWLAEFYRRLPL